VSSRRSTSCGRRGYCASTATAGELRLLPRPAARRRLLPAQPAAALAAPPARRAGPRTAARRRPRPGCRAAGRAVRPGGQPERAVATTARGGRGGGRVRHAEAIRLHSAALEIIRPSPPARPRPPELAVLEAMAAPLNARYGYASGHCRPSWNGRSNSPRLSAARTRSSTGWSGCGRPIRPGPDTGPRTGGDRALALAAPGSEISGAAHFAFAGRR
jgi:hypothetical protein